ncbi:hypothetical protein BCR33DRAFT_96806 [Rhizoclosmatium globosum]|uniref:Uncharacterized protein n=1 Tax=Rhizoclosmatium globosum TaxID=329046 RepID=A0A1Y2CK65_9FUNG|nr:hypothetical protein BCR33DRAFT_96806 [Rhizoclosmatium globosum]|eukprot:ORY47413.1 hypothetical protein BCR33DRAFT_96806 [Rhizoclosmatium globosum]
MINNTEGFLFEGPPRIIKRSLNLRSNITPEDTAAIILIGFLGTLSDIEAISFVAFATYTEYKKPNQDRPFLRRVFSKLNILLLTMFLGSFVWCVCACYNISLSHFNLTVTAPQAIQLFCSATLETCFMHFLWTISNSILRRGSNKLLFSFVSVIVTISPLLFYAQWIIFLIARLTGISTIISANRICAVSLAVAESLFCIYLIAIFCLYLTLYTT